MYQATTNKRKQYRCTVHGCPHVTSAAQLPHLQARCPTCNEVIPYITLDMLRRTNITCLGCGRSKFMPSLAGETSPTAMSDIELILSRTKGLL